MINTNELMLGNLVDHAGAYCTVVKIEEGKVDLHYYVDNNIYTGVLACNINPIVLTNDILRRLGEDKCGYEFLHTFQNVRNTDKRGLDITPLLKPKYLTQDNVVVSEGDTVYMVVQNSKGEHQIVTALCYGLAKNAFSTRESAESYIENLIPIPFLRTHDGVEVFDKNALVWVCSVDGMYSDTKNKNVPARFKAKMALSIMNDYMCVFSTESACSEYINQKWAELHPEPIFVTEDGVKMFEGMDFYFVEASGYYSGSKKSTIKHSKCYKDTKKNKEYKDFSTEQLAQAYLNKVWSKNEYNNLLKSTQCQNK